MRTLLAAIILMVAVVANGAFQTSVTNGLFSSTNTWGGTVPLDGEGFKINTNHTVIYDTNNLAGVGYQNVTNCGFLYFSNGLSVPGFGCTGFLMGSNMSGIGGTIQIGNPDNLMGFTSSNTTSVQIKWLRLVGSSCASTVLVYAVTNHLLQTFIATNGAANDTYIVVSNLPASIASNDVVVIGSTNRSGAVDPCIVSAVTNNTIWLKQSLSSETNNWSTGFSNKCNNAKTIGACVAFINTPVVFCSTNDVNSAWVFSANGNFYQGARFDQIGLCGTAANKQTLIGCVVNNHTSANGTFNGATAAATNCYFWNNAAQTGVFNGPLSLAMDSCCVFGVSGGVAGFGGSLSQVNMFNCVAFNCAGTQGVLGSSAPVSGTYSGVFASNLTAYYCSGALFSTIGGAFKNVTAVGCDSIFGGSSYMSIYNLSLFNSSIYSGNLTPRFNTVDGMTNNTSGLGLIALPSNIFPSYGNEFYNCGGGIPTNGSIGFGQSGNYSAPYVFSGNNETRWIYLDGSAYLTNNTIRFDIVGVSSNSLPHVAAVFPLSIRPNGSRSVSVQCLRTNNVSYYVQYGNNSRYNPASPFVATISAAADNVWTTNILRFPNNSTVPINATLSVICSATNATAAGYSKVFIGQDNVLKEF